jgi:transcription initiation factor TFIIIB Brf1 subunit/transcription initiation factor TFIIB
MKDISAITGLKNNSIYSMQEKDKVIILKPNEMLEKYCKYLNLDFKAYSVIKEKISTSLQSGHNPLTIIGANIYVYCKEKKLNYSMKKIASTLNISCISIQRYIKNINKV